MLVVKLGGSLMKTGQLSDWLEQLSNYGKGNVVIVTGGGIFADFIRDSQQQWKFDDASAHQMALNSMEQYAHYCHSLSPELILARSINEIQQSLINNKVPVCLPTNIYHDSSRLKQNWNTTSDSLAACLANDLRAEKLVLVKTIEAALLEADAATLVESGIIDPAFPLVLNKSIPFCCLSADKFHNVPDIFSHKSLN